MPYACLMILLFWPLGLIPLNWFTHISICLKLKICLREQIMKNPSFVITLYLWSYGDWLKFMIYGMKIVYSNTIVFWVWFRDLREDVSWCKYILLKRKDLHEIKRFDMTSLHHWKFDKESCIHVFTWVLEKELFEIIYWYGGPKFMFWKQRWKYAKNGSEIWLASQWYYDTK